MGYVYQGNRLCCDICGNAGARKYRCPFGYCPPIAACSECRKTKAQYFSKDYHRSQGCEQGHLAAVARDNERVQLIASGEYCLAAAIGRDDGWVHVVFDGKDNMRKGKLIPKNIYKFDSGNETISHFEHIFGGTLPDAPDTFTYSSE